MNVSWDFMHVQLCPCDSSPVVEVPNGQTVMWARACPKFSISVDSLACEVFNDVFGDQLDRIGEMYLQASVPDIVAYRDRD